MWGVPVGLIPVSARLVIGHDRTGWRQTPDHEFAPRAGGVGPVRRYLVRATVVGGRRAGDGGLRTCTDWITRGRERPHRRTRHRGHAATSGPGGRGLDRAPVALHAGSPA